MSQHNPDQNASPSSNGATRLARASAVPVTFVATCLIAFFSAAAQGAVVVSFNGGTTSTDYNVTSAAPGLTVGALTPNGITAISANTNFEGSPGYDANIWTTSSTPSLNSAWSFTITVASNYSVNFQSISFDYKPQGDSVRKVGIRVVYPLRLTGQVETYQETTIDTPPDTPAAFYEFPELTNSSNQYSANTTFSLQAGKTATIYLLGYDSTTSAKRMLVDKINVQGIVTVPEPSTTLLLALGLLSLAGFYLRRQGAFSFGKNTADVQISGSLGANDGSLKP